MKFEGRCVYLLTSLYIIAGNTVDDVTDLTGRAADPEFTQTVSSLTFWIFENVEVTEIGVQKFLTYTSETLHLTPAG